MLQLQHYFNNFQSTS